MSAKDPIYCFNGAECTYSGSCYDTRTDLCRLESLKALINELGILPPAQNKEQKPSPRAQAQQPAQSSPQQHFTPPPQQQGGGRKVKDFTQYHAINSGMKGIKVKGVVDSIEAKQVTVKGAPKDIIKVALKDGSEKLLIIFWNPSMVPQMEAGDDISVDGLMGSDPYNGTPQASGGDYVKIAFKGG